MISLDHRASLHNSMPSISTSHDDPMLPHAHMPQHASPNQKNAEPASPPPSASFCCVQPSTSTFTPALKQMTSLSGFTSTFSMNRRTSPLSYFRIRPFTVMSSVRR